MSALVTVLVAAGLGVPTSPLGAAVRALQSGNVPGIVDLHTLAVLAGWAMLATLAALFTFRWAPQPAS